jgi:hypothetical protein
MRRPNIWSPSTATITTMTRSTATITVIPTAAAGIIIIEVAGGDQRQAVGMFVLDRQLLMAASHAA